MEGLLMESIAAERIKDRRRAAESRRRGRPRKVRRPAASWVLAGAPATWLGR